VLTALRVRGGEAVLARATVGEDALNLVHLGELEHLVERVRLPLAVRSAKATEACPAVLDQGRAG